MLDVGDRLLKQVRDMVVVQVVADVTPLAAPHDEAEMAQQTQLMRDGRRFHADGLRELVDAQRAAVQAAEDAHTAGGRKCLHGVGNRASEVGVELVCAV